MRIGTNPNRGKAADAKLERVVLQVVTHLPNLEGYHQYRLEVVKACLTSMTRGIHMPYSLMICDNGSIPELVEWIQDCIRPTMLINSQNLGKTAQRKLMAQMLPPDSLLCYSDDDMLFMDNWLSPQIDLLTSFPKVACVSGYPVRTSFRWGNTNTKKWAERNALLEKGKFIPEQWEREFSISVGRDVTEHLINTKPDMDYRIDYKGRQAYATSHHCQQIGFAGVIARALEFDGETMGEERSFDNRLDAMGLRLATIERHCRHMGNVIDSGLRGEMSRNKKETYVKIGANTPMEV